MKEEREGCGIEVWNSELGKILGRGEFLCVCVCVYVWVCVCLGVCMCVCVCIVCRFEVKRLLI